MAITEKRKESMMQYAKKNLKRIPLDVKLEYYDRIKAHAATRNESVNGFIKRAIDEAIERDKSPASTGSPTEAVTEKGGILTPESLQAAQEAAKAVGEEVSAFVQRAIESQSRRDKVARLFGLAEDE